MPIQTPMLPQPPEPEKLKLLTTNLSRAILAFGVPSDKEKGLNCYTFQLREGHYFQSDSCPGTFCTKNIFEAACPSQPFTLQVPQKH